MARPVRCRRICEEPLYDSFAPAGAVCENVVFLTVDEYEAIRLIDLERCTHEQCAKRMDISRTTVTEVYEAARGKLADCLVNGKTLRIMGGHYRLCDGSALRYCQRDCRKMGRNMETPQGRVIVSCEHGQEQGKKGMNEMRIAVTYENGMVFQHFGHTEQFKLYDVEEGRIVKEEVVSTNGSGHGALAGFLTGLHVDVVICGGIGGGAQTALAEAGIRLYGGVNGSADTAARAFVEGKLAYNPAVCCDHHGHGEHGGHCGEDKHGCSC